ncbi:hypothetical protein ACFSUS_27380 [Spirosoma soli]|uniref:Uncharacterized protein n=1 Tax=Spirosoma soli TaxID=1770529 RepID=A0ABW5MFQ9_9BACT
MAYLLPESGIYIDQIQYSNLTDFTLITYDETGVNFSDQLLVASTTWVPYRSGYYAGKG